MKQQTIHKYDGIVTWPSNQNDWTILLLVIPMQFSKHTTNQIILFHTPKKIQIEMVFELIKTLISVSETREKSIIVLLTFFISY